MSTKPVTNNESYLEGLRTGDNSIVEQIFDNFKPPIIHLLLRKSATVAEAEDVFMDALEALFAKVRTGTLVLKDATFKTYLTAICLNHWHRKYRRKRFSAQLSPESLETLKSNDNLEEELLQAERTELFWDTFRKLGEACQQILQLVTIDNQSLKAVAVLLGYTYDYARKKKSRCQRKLVARIKADDRFKEIKQ